MMHLEFRLQILILIILGLYLVVEHEVFGYLDRHQEFSEVGPLLAICEPNRMLNVEYLVNRK
jgi:hypothetical protein